MKKLAIFLFLVLLCGCAQNQPPALMDLRQQQVSIERYEDLAARYPDTTILWNVPFQGSQYAPDTREITLTHLTPDEIPALQYLPKLHIIHAENCQDYAALATLQSLGYQVEASLPIGGQSCPLNVESLTLNSVTTADLTTALSSLPCLRQVLLQGTLPPAADLLNLRAQYPQVQIHWELTQSRKVFPDTTTTLERTDVNILKGMLPSVLEYFPELQSADFTDFPPESMPKLCSTFPQVAFVWDIPFGPITVSSDVQRIDLSHQPITDLAQLEAMLPYLPNLEWVDMSYCGIDDETMDALNNRYENIRFVWTVVIHNTPVRTDATTFMPVKNKDIVESRHIYPLRYCTDMICVDIGHMPVDNCEWAAYMPNLEYLILGETKVTDLSPLSGLKHLKYLELFTIHITDLSPLLGCTALEDLNLGLTYADPAPLFQMTWLKNLWWCDAATRTFEYYEEAAKLFDALPNTVIKFRVNHPTAGGWRYLPNYYSMRDLLEMPYLNQYR